MIVSQTGLVSDDLDSFENCRSYCRLPRSWDLSDVFLMIRLGLWVFRRKIRDVKCSFHFISIVPIINIIYYCWCWPWSPGWSGVCQVSTLESYFFQNYCSLNHTEEYCLASFQSLSTLFFSFSTLYTGNIFYYWNISIIYLLQFPPHSTPELSLCIKWEVIKQWELSLLKIDLLQYSVNIMKIAIRKAPFITMSSEKENIVANKSM